MSHCLSSQKIFTWKQSLRTLIESSCPSFRNDWTLHIRWFARHFFFGIFRNHQNTLFMSVIHWRFEQIPPSISHPFAHCSQPLSSTLMSVKQFATFVQLAHSPSLIKRCKCLHLVHSSLVELKSVMASIAARLNTSLEFQWISMPFNAILHYICYYTNYPM